MLACLAKDFWVPYEEAVLYAAYVQSPRVARSSGRDYLRTLTTAQHNMQAAGIPLTLSPASAEQRYYMCELGLSAPQRQIFLAQLSGRADVSDDYLQSLSPDTAVRRRESLLNPQDSDKRRACFARRLVLIEAFLHHDLGDGKAARAATTTGRSLAQNDPPVVVVVRHSRHRDLWTPLCCSAGAGAPGSTTGHRHVASLNFALAEFKFEAAK